MTELPFGEAPVEPIFWFMTAGLYHSEQYIFKDSHHHGFRKYRGNLRAVIQPEISLDVYCMDCESETVFSPAEYEDDWCNSSGEPIVKSGIYAAKFNCSRSGCGGDLYYVFLLMDGVVTKIGQYPSIADLLKPGIAKYSRVLDRAQISDWQSAIGLRAHGIGAGSYVYLRRIIESLVNSAAEVAISKGETTRTEYRSKHWPDKVKLLNMHLPNYLVENSAVYGVLSKGIHELTEDECADYFDVMNTSIQIICDEKLAELEAKEKVSAGSKALQKVLAEVSAKST